MPRGRKSSDNEDDEVVRDNVTTNKARGFTQVPTSRLVKSLQILKDRLQINDDFGEQGDDGPDEMPTLTWGDGGWYGGGDTMTAREKVAVGDLNALIGLMEEVQREERKLKRAGRSPRRTR